MLHTHSMFWHSFFPGTISTLVSEKIKSQTFVTLEVCCAVSQFFGRFYETAVSENSVRFGALNFFRIFCHGSSDNFFWIMVKGLKFFLLLSRTRVYGRFHVWPVLLHLWIFSRKTFFRIYLIVMDGYFFRILLLGILICLHSTVEVIEFCWGRLLFLFWHGNCISLSGQTKWPRKMLLRLGSLRLLPGLHTLCISSWYKSM